MTSQLEPVLDSVRTAVTSENWLAALALTLTLPDICSSIEIGRDKKKGHVGDWYGKWWDNYFGKSYSYGDGQTDFVTGVELYLLRCAYLHEGSDLSDPNSVKKYKATIDRFNFCASDDQHLKKHGTRVLLSARKFCSEMCSRAEKWEANVLSKGDAAMKGRASELLKIYEPLQVSAEAISKVEVAFSLLEDGRVLSRNKTGC
jgi:hypothetical protein